MREIDEQMQSSERPIHPDQLEASTGLASLLNLHRAELIRFLHARCGHAGDAEDLLQELWLKLANLNTGPIVNGRAYLFRMAHNLVLDRARGRRRAMVRDRQWSDIGDDPAKAPQDRPDPALPADEAMARDQEIAILHQAIDALPPRAQRALKLHRLDGLGQTEVSQIMGISRSGVEKHLAVAMRRLRISLADCGFFLAAASPDRTIDQGEVSQTDEQP